jgi:hypothetical protein
MSCDFNAYLRSKRFPTLAVIREQLQRAGGRVVIADEIDFTKDTGYVDIMLDGTPTGFEVYSSEIDDDRRARYRARLERAKAPPDEYLSILESCDFDLMFNAKGEREVTAARLVMTAIATAADGWVSDPQTGKTVRPGQEST